MACTPTRDTSMLMHSWPPAGCRRRWLAHYGVVALLAALPPASSTAVDTAYCAACVQSFRLLSSTLSSAKARLELSKEANDRKAQKVDRVQKAQTRRWLKNEYGVAPMPASTGTPIHQDPALADAHGLVLCLKIPIVTSPFSGLNKCTP